ncbi:hypothetical protein [Larkinella terrae]|uniref:Uncharacterized protein n=1 Tax=Larkinella terrae TaxID=2025311 RepID=A0A7K0EDL3_9BACT|nr:hypothetical protein [Larkinella terrae]MRS59865.1 hypothetical protein [Larkinella terrae]
MNTEQSYANVATGANVPEKTEIFNDDRSKIYTTAGIRCLLEDPQTLHQVRSCLRSWFTSYSQRQEESVNPVSYAENCGNYEMIDDWLSEIMDLHFGWYVEPKYKPKKPEPIGSTLYLQATNHFVEKAKAILKKQDELAEKVFGPQTLRLRDDEAVLMAAQTMRELKEIRAMLDELNPHL